MTRLFDPIRIGRLTLPNRIIMAPLTRGRTGAAGVPGSLVAEYYAQRAAAGVLITEATAVNREGDGWPRRIQTGSTRQAPRATPTIPLTLLTPEFRRPSTRHFG